MEFLAGNSVQLLTCLQKKCCILSWLRLRVIGIFQWKRHGVCHMGHAMHTWHIEVCRSSCFCGRGAARLKRCSCCVAFLASHPYA